jgi:hypothetical protein
MDFDNFTNSNLNLIKRLFLNLKFTRFKKKFYIQIIY